MRVCVQSTVTCSAFGRHKELLCFQKKQRNQSPKASQKEKYIHICKYVDVINSIMKAVCVRLCVCNSASFVAGKTRLSGTHYRMWLIKCAYKIVFLKDALYGRACNKSSTCVSVCVSFAKKMRNISTNTTRSIFHCWRILLFLNAFVKRNERKNAAYHPFIHFGAVLALLFTLYFWDNIE